MRKKTVLIAVLIASMLVGTVVATLITMLNIPNKVEVGSTGVLTLWDEDKVNVVHQIEWSPLALMGEKEVRQYWLQFITNVPLTPDAYLKITVENLPEYYKLTFWINGTEYTGDLITFPIPSQYCWWNITIQLEVVQTVPQGVYEWDINFYAYDQPS